jgi:peptidoglycan/LPS O-acetylase OafA/YrhL
MRNIHRDGFIDCLRGIAIVLVLGIHFFDMRNVVGGSDGSNPLYHLFGHGYFGVTIFFVISGYLIASTSLDNLHGEALRIDVPKFYARRATRILPLFALVLVLALALLVCFDESMLVAYKYILHTSDEVYTIGFWLSLVTFQYNWFKMYSHLHGSYSALQWDIIWSLSIEEQFYLLFPFVASFLVSKSKLRLAIIGVIVLGTAAQIGLCLVGYSVIVQTATFTCFPYIAVGVLVALSPPWPANSVRTVVPLAIMILVICYVIGGAPFAGLAFSGIAFATGLLIQGSRSFGKVKAIQHFSALARLGRLSYGAYLLHPVVFLASAVLVTSHRMNPLAGFLIVILATYLVAKVSFDFFERPVERSTRMSLYAFIERNRISAPFGRTSVGISANRAATSNANQVSISARGSQSPAGLIVAGMSQLLSLTLLASFTEGAFLYRMSFMRYAVVDAPLPAPVDVKIYGKLVRPFPLIGANFGQNPLFLDIAAQREVNRSLLGPGGPLGGVSINVKSLANFGAVMDGVADDERGKQTPMERQITKGSAGSYPLPSAALREPKARAARYGMTVDGPNAAASAPSAAATATPETGSVKLPRAFDASEGTALDPLLNMSYDLSSAKTVPPLK